MCHNDILDRFSLPQCEKAQKTSNFNSKPSTSIRPELKQTPLRAPMVTQKNYQKHSRLKIKS